jgi:disulfide bond formation protein DsbB
MTTTQSLRADWIAIAVGAGALALIMGALGYQYLGAMPPCPMCHWQRWPHIAAAIVGVMGGGFLPRRFAFPIATVTILLVLTSGLIGAWQTGFQWGVLPGPTTCSGARFVLGSDMAPAPSCSLLQQVFLGQTLAFWNAFFSLGLAGIGGVLLGKTAHEP